MNDQGPHHDATDHHTGHHPDHETLKQKGQQSADDIKEAAREQAESTQRMRDKDLHSLCRAAEDYGRREPAMFIGGAIAAGFLVTRFLRSSPDKAPAPAASSETAVPDQTL